ncbi:sarcosine oxidase subunit gamma [Tabrizicola sp. BL-A-41-H6]|uniref:sarcosine oxidase subunit gamma n=1 Tax=Tabrizicola sp. BL-A-41-H6 TaxID=3421107 RepID=UPI003D67536F
MPELIAKSALEGHGALTLGGATLAEVDVGPVTSVAILPGGEKAVAKALKPLGLAMPVPNSFAVKGAARIIWTGRDQAFLTGVLPPMMEGAAVTDQSDGWAVLSISGPAAVDALMRLVPMDLRANAFPVGRAVRAPLNHMNAVLLRTEEYTFELWVFRSMARTAWHEIEAAMQALAARAALKA